MTFIGRKHELASLGDEFCSQKPSLVVVYGRRRVGKSQLIQEAIRGRPHVFYQATRVAASLNLEAFKAEIARELGDDPLLASIGDWLGVLQYLARSSKKADGLIIVLDEFPYLADGDAALPSVIQKFWDSGAAKARNLKLVLCGSMIAQMEDLLAERNPLYGRKTMSLEVDPLPVRDASLFFPNYSPEQKLMAYAVFGGVPYYLQLCDPSEALEENIIRLILSKAGTLVDEPTVLLQAELRDIQRYASLLAAIADGCTKYGEILNRVREISESKTLGTYVDKLERMRLIKVVRSMDSSPKERDRRYFIADPLITFWHKFVRPNLSSIAQGFGSDVWKHQIAPHMSDYMGLAFEEICRDHARRYAQERLPAPAQQIGQIWAADFDIDVAGRLLQGSMIYGECKWTGNEVGEAVLDKLIERAGKTSYGQGVADRHFALYARIGFTRDLEQRASKDPNVVLYHPADVLGLARAKRPTPRSSKKRPSKATDRKRKK